MESHKELTLSDLRRYIIRYGAKYMEAYESDLYYDCKEVESMVPGDSLFWFVSGMHTYMYSAKEIYENGLKLSTLNGSRFNYRIDCVKGRLGDMEYAMTEVSIVTVQDAVNEYQKNAVVEG